MCNGISFCHLRTVCHWTLSEILGVMSVDTHSFTIFIQLQKRFGRFNGMELYLFLFLDKCRD